MNRMVHLKIHLSSKHFLFLWILISSIILLFVGCDGGQKRVTGQIQSAASPTEALVAFSTPSVSALPTNTSSPVATPTPTPLPTPNTIVTPTPTAQVVKPTPKPATTTERTTQVTKNKYLIRVNLATQVVAVFTYDETGDYTKPVRSMVCSTGRNGATPAGTFRISSKYRWRALVGNVYGQYAIRFNGSILFHSTPYTKAQPDTLIAEEYNKLGTAVSAGCVRLQVADALWIYNNCGTGTVVEIVNNGTWEGVPSSVEVQKIATDATWDPTDPDLRNPFLLEPTPTATIEPSPTPTPITPDVTPMPTASSELTPTPTLTPAAEVTLTPESTLAPTIMPTLEPTQTHASED